jgi:DNA-binding NtrC family response regulator
VRWNTGGSRSNNSGPTEGQIVKEKLESLVAEMIERRIYLDEALNEFEKRFIQSALTQTRGNQTKAAQVLGVHRNTLNRKITQHKLNGRR